LYFIYEAIVKWSDPEATPWLGVMIAGLAILCFFFRRKYARRWDNDQS
jgi:hypothetical protein